MPCKSNKLLVLADITQNTAVKDVSTQKIYLTPVICLNKTYSCVIYSQENCEIALKGCISEDMFDTMVVIELRSWGQ